MLQLNKLHHIAIICSDYEKSKRFYINVLGLTPGKEVFREERKSYKLDLYLNGTYIVELFSFPEPPKRSTGPEATGLRHLAFEVDNITDSIKILTEHKVKVEPLRVDEFTQKKFTFFFDPDHLPIELYEK